MSPLLLLRSVTIGIVVYYTIFAIINLFMTVIGTKQRWRRTSESVEEPSLPATIAIPAYNEAETVTQSLITVLNQSYPVSVVLIDDGSTDETFDAVADRFALAPVDSDKTKFKAQDWPLTVFRQKNMGKAAALNKALDRCETPLFGVVDADTMVESGYLAKLAAPFENGATVATGGSFCIVDSSSVIKSPSSRSLPRSWFQRFQAINYLRALSRQLGRERIGGMVAPPGACSLFRTEVVRDIGGFDDVETEDLELAVRLFRHCTETDRDAKFVQVPDAVGWTTVPTTTSELDQQRKRWIKGILATVIRHRGIIGRRRYGRAATVGLPHLIFGELFWRLLHGVGIFTLAIAWLIGAVQMLVVLVFVGAVLIAGPLSALIAVVGTQSKDTGYDDADRRILLITAAMEWLAWRPLLTFLELLDGIGYLRTWLRP